MANGNIEKTGLITNIFNTIMSNAIAFLALVVASLALVVSLVGFYLDSKITVEINHHLAASPDFSSPPDVLWLERRGLKARVLQSQFFRAAKASYEEGADREYLLITFLNQGPGRVTGIHFSDIAWFPKENQREPSGLNVAWNPGVLQMGEFYAILIDVLESPDPIEPLNDTHYGFLEFDVEYTDIFGRKHRETVTMGDEVPPRVTPFPTPPSAEAIEAP